MANKILHKRLQVVQLLSRAQDATINGKMAVALGCTLVALVKLPSIGDGFDEALEKLETYIRNNGD